MFTKIIRQWRNRRAQRRKSAAQDALFERLDNWFTEMEIRNAPPTVIPMRPATHECYIDMLRATTEVLPPLRFNGIPVTRSYIDFDEQPLPPGSPYVVGDFLPGNCDFDKPLCMTRTG